MTQILPKKYFYIIRKGITVFKDTLSHSGTHEMEEKMKRRASLTVEASLILPVFLYAMLFLAYIGQLVICQD